MKITRPSSASAIGIGHNFVQLTVRVGIDGVEAKVAALGIFCPILGKLHHCAASIGFDILAQRCDFKRASMHHGRDGSVFNSGRNSTDSGSFQGRQRLLRGELCRDVDVVHRRAA